MRGCRKVAGGEPTTPIFMARRSIPVWCMAVLMYGPCAFGSTNGFSGIIWEDVDRDGIREAGEPALVNQKVFISEYLDYEDFFHEPFATNFTDANGRFTFTGFTNIARSLFFFPDGKYRVTSRNEGDDEIADSDFYQGHTFCGVPYPWMSLEQPVTNRSSIDAGLFALVPGITATLTVNGYPADVALHVTNGSCVSLDFTVSNIGETWLSYLNVYFSADNEVVEPISCPRVMFVGETVQQSHSITVLESMTNETMIAAFAVDACTCRLHGSDPPFLIFTNIFLVVTNDALAFEDGDPYPNNWEVQFGLDPLNSNSSTLDRDGDGMTDYEEYLANTSPTNHTSYFAAGQPSPGYSHIEITIPTSFPDRLYGVWRTSNLLDGASVWELLSPEQTGTGGNVSFVITNGTPGSAFRTGVRIMEYE